ncbi:MAG: hypothetical protein CSA75_05630 [Sorangium cellulosum]|nr:MAG: hypothetical protein CSA75_05630 [Sorangium cellulosum]
MTPCTATADDDPWFGPDKAKHFGASAILAAGGYTLGVGVFKERSSALAFGGGVALTAGVGKEVYDATGRGDPSARDFVWDIMGTASGLAMAWLVDILIRGDDPAHETTPTDAASICIHF